MSGKGKKDDIPNSEKSARLSKSRNSFRFGKKKSSSVSRASGISGKVVQVKGISNVEELERKKADVFTSLECSVSAVNKNIPAYLLGIPSMVIENVILLTRVVDRMNPNANSSEFASLTSHLNQTMADHALWIDHHYLYGDGTHSEQSINTIVQNVKEAVQSLVEFAINKENQNVSDSNFNNSDKSHNESNSSLCSQDSPCSRKKLNETRNSHTHGSMPEIPSAASTYGGSNRNRNTPPPSKKLTHSFSSDSILENSENITSPTKPSSYGADLDGTSSCDESPAPKIPPKGNKGRSSLRSSYTEFDSPASHSPFNSSFDDDTSFQHRGSAGYLISCSTPQSPDYSLTHSPSTSHDSVHQTPPSYSNHRMGGSNSLGSIDLNPRVTDLTTMISNNFDISPLRTVLNDKSNCSTLSSSSSTMNSKSFYSETILTISSEAKMASMNDSSIKETSSHAQSVSSSQHHLVIRRSPRDSTCSSSRSSGSEVESNAVLMNVPPPIPKKNRPPRMNTSHYDNVDGMANIEMKSDSNTKAFGVSSISCSASSSSTSGLGSSKSSMTSWKSSTSSNSLASSSVVHRSCNETFTNHSGRAGRTVLEKPPLPIKNRHIEEYMRTFKNYQMPEKGWFQDRRSQQVISSYLTTTVNLSDDLKELDLDSHTLNTRFSLPNHTSRLSPPPLPPKMKPRSPDCHQSAVETSPSQRLNNLSSENEMWQPPQQICSCPAKEVQTNLTNNSSTQFETPVKVVTRTKKCEPKPIQIKEIEEKRPREEILPSFVEEVDADSLLDCLNVNEHIVFEGEMEESEVKAGSIDSLVVYATYSKNGNYLEAFLTTYRTFLTPSKLIGKLFYRYYKFVCRPSTEYQKAAKNAFSLLVRVVHDLVVTELSDALLKDLARFDFNLLSKGDLMLALFFRSKLSDKLKLRKTHQEQSELPTHYMTIKDPHHYTFLDFKSSDIADQMTLLDSEPFNKFGIPELLHYARDQNEEQCPNLSTFAMQINRVSSWVITLILKSNSQDREKYYKKFIKVMRCLRKLNNFNSCMAILSGIESPHVRRLFLSSGTDMLKEYSDLFDFEGSYRAYRQALAETKPPCIPHLAIILQDLTKLYNINPNIVDGKVNFAKRMLQFNILEDMKRFIPSKYNITKNDSIRNWINNYEDCMSDSDLWDLSLNIKPKAKHK